MSFRSVRGWLPPAILVKFSDEATETVARDELLAVQLEARLGRGVVVLEPLFDGAAFVRMAIHLSAFAAGRVRQWVNVQEQAQPLPRARAVRHTVFTGSVMISVVIEHMNTLGTSASLASDGPAAPLLPPSAVARSNPSALASGGRAVAGAG